jgi:hypothetical protein
MRKFEAKEAFTPKEQKVVSYLRQKYDAWIQEANTMRKMVGKKPIPYRQDYMTHIREQNLLHDFFKGDEAGMASVSESQMDAIRKSDYTKGNMPFNRFALKRFGEKTKFDAIGNYVKYMEVILKEIYYTPAITHARKFMDYALSKQPNAYKSLDRLMNDLKGKASIADQNIIGAIAGSKPVKFLRSRIAQNALVGNINFWAINLSNFTIAYDEIGNYLNVGVAKFIGTKEWRAFAFKHSVMLKGRSIDPDIDPSVMKNITKTIGAVTNVIEYNNVGSTFVGAYHKAIEKLHYSQPKAIKYADAIARRTQAGYKKYEVNAWMRSNSGMLMSQFQTWSFNAMNHVLYDLGVVDIPEDIKNIFRKDKKQGLRWGAFLTLIGTSIAVNAIYKSIGLRQPYTIDAAIPSIAGISPGRYNDIGPNRIAKDVISAVSSKKSKTRKAATIRVLSNVVTPAGGTQIKRFLGGKVFPEVKDKKKRGWKR